jgi:hypothetical protein
VPTTSHDRSRARTRSFKGHGQSWLLCCPPTTRTWGLVCDVALVFVGVGGRWVACCSLHLLHLSLAFGSLWLAEEVATFFSSMCKFHLAPTIGFDHQARMISRVFSRKLHWLFLGGATESRNASQQARADSQAPRGSAPSVVARPLPCATKHNVPQDRQPTTNPHQRLTCEAIKQSPKATKLCTPTTSSRTKERTWELLYPGRLILHLCRCEQKGTSDE